MKVTLELTKAQALALLRSDGLTMGHGVRKSQLKKLADTIGVQAQAIAAGTLAGPLNAAIDLLHHNVDTLAAWVADPRDR